MEWWRLLLADGCPVAGKSLPHCLGDRTGEHDRAEAGELAQASMVRAGMGLLMPLCSSPYAAAQMVDPCQSKSLSARTLQQGGIALVDIPAQLTALQAKIIGRLLEPQRVPWTAYFSGWLAMPLTAEQRAAVPAHFSALVAAGHRAALLQLP